MNGVLSATILIGLIGLIIGLLLGFASKKFKIESDPRVDAVREVLPGNNCGACGYPGCDGLAAAIAEGKAKVNTCPVGGDPVGEKVAAIMGVKAEKSERLVAYVRCNGTCENISENYNYYGLHDCNNAKIVPGSGGRSCSYGCMGFGSCVKVCQFDAIHVIDGVAKVDKEKCRSCGKCRDVCPQSLIEMIPYDAQYHVTCHNLDKGALTVKACKVGFIGCGICTHTCEEPNAILLDGFCAFIDHTKCTNCGKCAEKCPRHIIM